jgi:hypothetical protein
MASKNRGLDHNEQRSAMPRARPTPSSYANPGRAAGSFQYKDRRSGKPTNILDGCKQSFGGAKGGYGDVDDGDGTGIDTTYRRGAAV